MIYLKYNTASQEVPLGQFVDSTDGNTEETGLTIANTDIKLWKAGATTLANKNSGGATHISNGVYYTVLDATDTNTYGSLVIFVHVSGALPVRLECLVVNASVYDALVSATDNLDVNVSSMSGDVITSAALSATASAEIADAVWDEALSGHTTEGSSGKYLTDIESQTDDIGSAGAGLTAIPWNAAWDVETQSEVQDALDAILADSLPSDGTRPSAAQALYGLWLFMTERAVSGTTVTVKKVDGTTAAMTLTLDSATSPTSITRAT